jgi:hypothetical protein
METVFNCIQRDGVMGVWKRKNGVRNVIWASGTANLLSGVNTTTASPGDILSIAVLSAGKEAPTLSGLRAGH